MRQMSLLAALVLLGTAPAAVAQEVKITHGPLLGRLTSHSVGVWARTEGPGAFRVRYGLKPDRLEHYSPVVATRLEDDCTGWVLLKDLDGNTEYHYQLAQADGTPIPGTEGSFYTLPRAEDYRHPQWNPRGLFNFRFEFGCGNNQTPGQGAGPNLPAFKTMLEKLYGRCYFTIFNGDWLYEDHRDFPAEQWRLRHGLLPEELPRVVRLAPTVVGVWENYKVYLSRGKNLARYHRHMPAFFTFDDHEILNDVWGAGTPGLVDRRAVFRDIALTAWYDYLGWSNPVEFRQDIHLGKALLRKGEPVLLDPQADFTKLDLEQAANLHVHWGTPTAGVNDNALDELPPANPNAGVYRIEKVLGPHRLQIWPAPRATAESVYSIGRRSYYQFRVANCHFFCLDTRTHRQMHDVRQPDKPGLSMLGPAQRRWLMKHMRESDAEFFFVVSSVNFMVPHVGGGKIRAHNKDDAWTVFLEERETLIRFWDSLGKPVFVLTGDLHNSFAIKITDRVWEFASGPHNSNNHWYTDEGNRPAAGRFKYGPRECEIRWSTFYLNDIPRRYLQHPVYCVVQVNNVFNNPRRPGEVRWVAFERPQVVFQYYDGRTGQLLYAEAIPAAPRRSATRP